MAFLNTVSSTSVSNVSNPVGVQDCNFLRNADLPVLTLCILFGERKIFYLVSLLKTENSYLKNGL